MGHQLSPRTGGLLPVAEVVRRLQEEFRVVKTDAEAGMRQALSTAAWLERMPASAFLGRHEAALEEAGRLRALSPGEALVVEFGDEPDRALRTYLISGDPIQFGYQSDEHEAECRPLIERCARVLDCDIVLF